MCTAGSRLFVEQSAFDRVVEGVAEFAKSIKVGPGLNTDTQMGPLVSSEQLDRVTGLIRSGVEEGASLATGGRRIGNEGYFVEPTIIVDAGRDTRVMREEIFGPVVVATPVKSMDDIVPAANDTVYGLGGSIWTRDISKAHRLAARIKAGTVWINTHNMVDMAMPFGGYKQSGWGRESGHDGIDLYTETKSVIAAL